jgi:GNAT superfamily N-acetyltransferase
MEPGLVVAARPMTHPDAAALVREMTVEVCALYGEDPDAPSSLTPEMFAPPDGGFLVGYLSGRPVACAGFCRIDAELAQANRVFVRPEARGQAIARQMMGHVEGRAVEAGYRTLRLETGILQPAAMRTYEGLGYEPIPRFAPYESDPRSRCYAKRIG